MTKAGLRRQRAFWFILLRMDAHNFTLTDQNGAERSLSDFRNKWVVLYFYPKDETSGCVAEACAFRDAHEQLLAKNAVVIGVSRDSVQSHADFARHHNLPFILLSDPHGLALKPYGAWLPLLAKRTTFIIDPAGKIVKEYPDVTPAEHAGQILADLQALQER